MFLLISSIILQTLQTDFWNTLYICSCYTGAHCILCNFVLSLLISIHVASSQWVQCLRIIYCSIQNYKDEELLFLRVGNLCVILSFLSACDPKSEQLLSWLPVPLVSNESEPALKFPAQSRPPAEQPAQLMQHRRIARTTLIRRNNRFKWWRNADVIIGQFRWLTWLLIPYCKWGGMCFEKAVLIYRMNLVLSVGSSAIYAEG